MDDVALWRGPGIPQIMQLSIRFPFNGVAWDFCAIPQNSFATDFRVPTRKTAEPRIFADQKRITTDFTNGNCKNSTTYFPPASAVPPVRIRVNPQFNP